VSDSTREDVAIGDETENEIDSSNLLEREHGAECTNWDDSAREVRILNREIEESAVASDASSERANEALASVRGCRGCVIGKASE
jgi:hypothetical protein